MLELPIGPVQLGKEDQVVSAFPWRDSIIVVTRFGKIFQLGVGVGRGDELGADETAALVEISRALPTV